MSRVPCAFSVQEEFLVLIDARAASLGMKRSEFIVQALRKELLMNTGGMNIVAEQRGKNNTQINHNFSAGSTTGPALYKKAVKKKK